MTNEEFATGLRQLAYIYEKNPHIKQPRDSTEYSLFICCHSKESLADLVRAFGPGTKKDGGSTVDFIPNTLLKIQISGFKSSVCEAIVVGKKTVPERIVPEVIYPEHEEDIIEYRCAPFLENEHETS